MTDTAVANNAQPTEMANAEVTRGVTLTPRVDILETEHELLLFADLPGVTQEQVDLRFEKGELTLHARRSQVARTATQILAEKEPSDYFRAFRISEQVNAEKIWAEMKHGVLKLHLPKVEAVKPRKIAIKAG